MSYPADPVSPSVNRTKEWCVDNCQGTQWSNATQWIQPLAAWIAPYIGLLLLCPVGEKPDKKKEKRETKREKLQPKPERSEESTMLMTGDEAAPARNGALKSDWMTNRSHWQRLRTTCRKAYTWCCNAVEYLRFPAQEYVMLIGDPASALWGSFAELYHDWVMVRGLEWRPQWEVSYQKMGLVILAGETAYDSDLTKKLDERIRRLVDKIHPGEKPVEQKVNTPWR